MAQYTFSIAAGADDGWVRKDGATWPPTSAAVVNTTALFLETKKIILNNVYEAVVTLLRWDTSSLSGMTIASADLKLHILGLLDADARNVQGQWYSWTPPLAAGDWVLDLPTADAFDVDITTLATGWQTISLGTLTGINKTGYTGIRLAITGGQPAGQNEVLPDSYERDGDDQAQLIVTTLEISSISPASGTVDGGTAFILTGTGFTGVTDVTFGGVSATSLSVVSDTKIVGVTPAGADVGAVDVVVTNPSGSDTLSGGYLYHHSPATYVIEVDWNGDGDWGDTGEDVTARTREVRYWLGRDYASQLVGRAGPGGARIVLDNRSGDYSPYNTSSPLTGNLKPGPKRKVRIRTTSPSVHTLWTGYIKRIEPRPSLQGGDIAVLDCTGALGVIAQRKTRTRLNASGYPTNVIENIMTDEAVDDILNEIGWSATDRTIDTAAQTQMKAFFVPSGTSALEALRKCEDTENGFLYDDVSGKIVFEGRHHRYSSPHTTSQATFSDATGASLSYSDIRQEDDLPFVFNVLEATVTVYETDSAATLWTCPQDGANANAPAIPPGANRDFWVAYPVPDSAIDHVAVNAWTAMDATDYTGRSAANGTGTNHDGDLAINFNAYADAAKVNISNNHATATVYVCGPTPTTTGWQVRGTPVKVRADPVTVHSEDSASIADYGERTYPHPGEFIPDIDEAQDWVDANLGIYKDQQPILSIVVQSRQNATYFDQILGRTISDRVTLVANTNTGLGITSADFFIERMEHHIDRMRHHVATYYLSSATAYSGFFVLDIAVLPAAAPGNTKLAY